MDYKTSEAKRKANREYRKRNKESERLATYRRTTKGYLTKHATFPELLDFQRYIFNRVDQLIDSPEYSSEDKLELEKMFREVLDEFQRSE
ncbi:hypothetical protein [Enterococcus pallens]|uniref:Uncharacterized protein n=1 Tax=Enterococcus pallens ATCC BAA-351 TaxID=1158607 RepID=R2SDW2_9ENTE|nr:hypothetical protein [Enterococcus pallens]EOH86334.1 hypothetical protein UAU_05256 [Enterococcus pallens ATCC BAA-351]EOU09445.1 hypothetical protein I588_05178 [Enterococcus pallens ATCC BAA-351]OJG77558.1 hypothetical protein RV10_GL002392 [Enterococcus pallens]